MSLTGRLPVLLLFRAMKIKMLQAQEERFPCERLADRVKVKNLVWLITCRSKQACKRKTVQQPPAVTEQNIWGCLTGLSWETFFWQKPAERTQWITVTSSVATGQTCRISSPDLDNRFTLKSLSLCCLQPVAMWPDEYWPLLWGERGGATAGNKQANRNLQQQQWH